MAQREDRTEEFVEVRIPGALADRIDDVYAACRGYESSSMQESLSVLCDIAAGRLHVPDELALDRDDGSAVAGGPIGADPVEELSWPTGVVSELSDERRRIIDAAFPTRWSADPTVAARLTAVVDRYMRNPEGMPDADAREADALHVVGEREGLSPDDLREQLVTALYGNTGLPDDLAGEFFSEALATVEEAASEESESDGDGDGDVDSNVDARLEGPDSPVFDDDGPPALTGGPSAGAAGPASDLDPEAAFDSPTDEVTVDSLLADEAAPTARCERCEAYHEVDDLETVIGSAASTIELLCSSCATAVGEKD